MLDTKDFSFFENQNSFDFKGFLVKTASYWKWFLLGLIICFTIAHQVNVRKQKIYSLDTTIAVKEQDNPLFTNNTSLIFNWGGASDQVQSIATTIRSRSHNEIVVDRLNFFIDYLQEQKYFTQDVYGNCPFALEIDKSNFQLLHHPITINFIDNSTFTLQVEFDSDRANVYNYTINKTDFINVKKEVFKSKFKVGQNINLPYLKAQVKLINTDFNYLNKDYIVKINTLDETALKYRAIKINIDEKAGSILNLSLQGTNKARIVDYLNETVNTLTKRQLDSKNLFADNTIKYIDTTLAVMENTIKQSNDEMKKFSKNKNIVEIGDGGGLLQSELKQLDQANEEVNRKINYYNTLNSYLKNSQNYSKLPAPSVAGIDDPNILTNVASLIELSVEKSKLPYSTKSDLFYDDIDNKISSIKKVLLENIRAAKSGMEFESSLIKSKLGNAEMRASQLPEDYQEYTSILRKYDLNRSIYETYLQKRSEASIVKAANLSDIQFIDPAKDIGGGLIGPRTQVNYVIALFLGLLIPLFIVFLIFFINNAIQNTDDINAATQIPLIGLIGLKHGTSNLAVFEKPKSALAESIRAIRSSLQFIFKKNKLEGAKTIMLTSSVAGEGKTFCSINIATVFALSEKKTVLVGLDLRKPKIYNDFDIDNKIGVVNYLIGEKTIEEITKPSKIPYLDVITSGIVPPNPSELIMGETMINFIDSLKEKYEYIILDTPPVGLVTDAVEISPFADVTLYVMRQNFTKKGMINLLNNRVKRDELKNVSIVLNGFENKAKYGAAYNYGYGYGYGYGNYSSGYHEEEKPKNFFIKHYQKFLTFFNNEK